MAHTTAYTIGTAARLTGVPAWRLRAWESAGLLRPDRSASGYRIYERADLDQISRLNDAIARGGRLAAHALVERPAGEPSSDNGAEPRPRADEILASLARIAGAEWCGLLWPDRQGRLAILATAGAGAPRPRALTAEEEVAWTRVTLHEHVSVQPPDLAPFASGELTTTIVRSTGTRGAIVLARARNALAPDVARLAVLAVTRQAELMRERDRHDRRQEELLVARAFGTALASHGEMDDLLEAALDQFIDFTRFDAGLVGLADPTGRRFVAAAARGFSARFLDGIRDFRTDEGIAGRAYTAGRPMIVRDLRTDPRVTRAPVRAEGLRTYLSIPLLHRHRAIGLVELGSRRPDMARSGDVEYLMVLTEILAAAVVNIQLADRLAIEREERANLVRSWGADIAAARTAGLAAAATRLERMHVGGGDLAGLIGELRRPGASCFDPDEIVAQALAAGRRDGSGVRVMVTSDWGQPPADDVAADATAVLRELVRVAVCNEADELVVHLAGPEAAPAIEAREVRVSAMPLLVRPALPGGLLVTQDEDALVTTTFVTLARRRTPPGASLTTREVQVLQLFAESNTTREVAALIGISSKTLANGLTTTYGKLGVTSRTQAVTEAIRRGLVRIPD